MKYLECHQYEPDYKNFEACSVTMHGLSAITEHCIGCRYNTFDEAATKSVLCEFCGRPKNSPNYAYHVCVPKRNA